MKKLIELNKKFKKLVSQLEGKKLLSMQIVYVNDNETRDEALTRLNNKGIETPRPLFIEWI